MFMMFICRSCFIWAPGDLLIKLNLIFLLFKGTYDKLYKEVPTYKLITPSIVSERLKERFSGGRHTVWGGADIS